MEKVGEGTEVVREGICGRDGVRGGWRKGMWIGCGIRKGRCMRRETQIAHERMKHINESRDQIRF